MTYNIDTTVKLSSSNQDELFIRLGTENIDFLPNSDTPESVDPKEYVLELIEEWKDAPGSNGSDSSMNALLKKEVEQLSSTPIETLDDFDETPSIDSLADSDKSMSSSPETPFNQPEDLEIGWNQFLKFEKEKSFYSLPGASFSTSNLHSESSSLLESSSLNFASAPQPSISPELQLSWSTYHQKKTPPLPKPPARKNPPAEMQELPENNISKMNKFLSRNKTRVLTGIFVGATVPAVIFGAPVTVPLIAGSLCAGVALGANETKGYLDKKINEAPSDADHIKVLPQLMGGIEVNMDRAKTATKVAEGVELTASVAGTGIAMASGFINPADVAGSLSNAASGAATVKDVAKTAYDTVSKVLSKNDTIEQR